MYVINYHSDEAQFRFFDHPEEYIIPGKQAVPDGGTLELFLDPGYYRWASVIQFANLRGEGELQIVAGQIYGLGLAHGKIGPQDVVEGLSLGADPLSPPVTPSPTPVPTPPTPSPGKVTLALYPGQSVGEVRLREQTYFPPPWQKLFLELDPGYYELEYIVDKAGPYSYTPEHPDGEKTDGSVVFRFELLPDEICDLRIEIFSIWDDDIADMSKRLICQPNP